MPINLPVAAPFAPPPPARLPAQATAAPGPTPAPGTPDSAIGDDAPLLPLPQLPDTPEQFAEAMREAFGVSTNTEVRLTADHAETLGRALDAYGALLGEAITEAERGMREPPALPPLPTPAQRLEADQHRQALQTVQAMQDVVLCHLDGADLPRPAHGTPAHALSIDIQEDLRAAEAANGAPLTPTGRCEVILHTLNRWAQAIVHNDSDSVALRHLANIAHSTVKTGLVVLVMTMLRQYVGKFTEVLLQTREAGPTARTLIGLAWMSLGPALTAAGALADHADGRATANSQHARLAMILTALVTTAGMFATDTLSAHASFGAQTTSYCFGRDFAQLFYTVRDNAPLTLGSTVVGGLAWSALQFWTSLANDYLAPNSGAGYVLSLGLDQAVTDCANATTAALDATTGAGPAGQASVLYDALCATGVSIGDLLKATALATFLRGVINAIPEIADDQVRQAAALHGSGEGLRVHAGTRIPSGETVYDTALTTFPARTTIFNNIVGAVLAIDAVIGHRIPPGHGRNALMASVGTVLCFGAYVPLLMAHDRRPAQGNAPPPPPAEAPAGLRRRDTPL